MKGLIKKIVHPIWAKIYFLKNKKVTNFSKYGIQLKIYPTVFHPGVFFSTQFFIQFLTSKNLKNQSLLELGAGSGLISFYASKQGANVVATDINPEAIRGLKENALNNQLAITIIESNLFEHVRIIDFDLIIINPPYYPKNPSNLMESAFYCGEQFEYFHQLFQQISMEESTPSELYMILSEDCNIEHIKTIAATFSIYLILVKEYKNWFEKNTIFQLSTHNIEISEASSQL